MQCLMVYAGRNSGQLHNSQNMIMSDRKRIPIGFQLWAARGEFSRNVPGTLRKVAEMGYEGVEFWDYAGTPQLYQKYSAPKMRDLLDEHGLKCCGMHVKLEALAVDKLPHTIETCASLGNNYVTLAGAKECMADEPHIRELARLLDKAASVCRPHKVILGYHAHPFDFKKIGGRFAW